MGYIYLDRGLTACSLAHIIVCEKKGRLEYDQQMINEECIKKEYSCCFTGHRPEKLQRPEASIRKELKEAVSVAYSEGYRAFICGMARGSDIWAGEIIIEMKKTYPGLILVCAIPFPNFEKSWSRVWRERYNAVLAKADHIENVSDAFSYEAYQRRNEWMVNHSSKVIAVYRDIPSGTRNTIQYAERLGISCVVIEA